MKSFITITLFSLGAITLGAGIASAHAVVTPHQAGIGSFQTFSLAIPSEKPENVIAVRLVLPEGVSEVTPDVKPGWKITTKKDANDEVTEINWTGGVIPTDLRDQFSFSAQVPATVTTINWKAYQTYADGSVVSWDQTPTADGGVDSVGDTGPYSTTNVINDLAVMTTASSQTTRANWALGLSIFALLMAGLASSKSRL